MADQKPYTTRNAHSMHYSTRQRRAWEPDGESWSCIHHPDRCEGEPCVIHHPSHHSMVGFPRHLRETGLVERICPHGIGHPDPDSGAWLTRLTGKNRRWDLHGCDGCCGTD